MGGMNGAWKVKDIIISMKKQKGEREPLA